MIFNAMQISDEQIINLKNKVQENIQENRQRTAEPLKETEKETDQIEWQAPEFVKYEKDKNWFIAGGILLAALIFVAIFTKSYIMGITFFLIGFVVFLYALKEPRTLHFSLSSRGIKIEDRLYDFDDLKSFWIFYDPPEVKEISFRSKKMFMTHIRVPIGNEDPTEIRKFIKKFLPEKKQEESLTDILARRIGF